MQRLNTKLLFLMVGGCAFLVDASIYLIFADIFDLHPFWARLIAFFIAVGVTCIGNRKFTFANSHLSPILTQYTKAILAAVVSLIPNMMVFLVLLTLLPKTLIFTLFAFGAGTVVGIALNFFLSKHYVFTGAPLLSYKIVYDDENRLTSLSGDDTASFVYDAMGRLSRTTINGTETNFLYDGDALAAEYNSSGTMIKRYVHGDRVDEPWIEFSGTSTSLNNTRFLHADHQGSVIAKSNTSGNVTHTNAYDAYGLATNTNEGRFGYSGQIWFSELSLNYYKARLYHPNLGRFLQTDPVFYEDQMNLYAYVHNDPVNLKDPSGKSAIPLNFANPLKNDPAANIGTKKQRIQQKAVMENTKKLMENTAKGAEIALMLTPGGAGVKLALASAQATQKALESDTPTETFVTEMGIELLGKAAGKNLSNLVEKVPVSDNVKDVSISIVTDSTNGVIRDKLYKEQKK